MLPALDRAPEHVGGLAVAIQPKQTQYRAGAPPQDIELLVCRNQIVGEQVRRRSRVCEQVTVMQALRYHGQRVDDRTQPGGTAGTQGSRQRSKHLIKTLGSNCIQEAQPRSQISVGRLATPRKLNERREGQLGIHVQRD
jgi:hypothetical protein